MTPCPSDPKTCFKCGITKTRADFYAHPQTTDGLRGNCKECSKKDSIIHRESKLEEVRKYDREREKLPHRIALRVRAQAEYKKQHPDRWVAKTILNNAIRWGKLSRLPCEICGNEKSQAHHEDYSKPLEVVWLCKPHHFQADARRRERESQTAII